MSTSADGSTVTVTDTRGATDGTGTDSLSNVETLEFADGTLTVSDDRNGEARVNTYTSGNQHDPSVTGLAGGNYVVTWEDDSGHGEGSSQDIRAQVYNALGQAVGEEVLVNTTTYDEQANPKVADLKDGGFVVTWHSERQDGDGNDVYNVYGQRYDSAGAAKGDEFLINTNTSGNQYYSSVAKHGDGFAVTWYDTDGSNESQGGSSWDVFAKTFTTKDGTTPVDTPVAGVDEFLVNTFTTEYQYQPDIAGLADGGFVVTWQSERQDGDSNNYYNVYAQRYDATGSAEGSEFLVNTYTSGQQYYPCLLYTSPSPRD